MTAVTTTRMRRANVSISDGMINGVLGVVANAHGRDREWATLAAGLNNGLSTLRHMPNQSWQLLAVRGCRSKMDRRC